MSGYFEPLTDSSDSVLTEGRSSANTRNDPWAPRDLWKAGIDNFGLPPVGINLGWAVAGQNLTQTDEYRSANPPPYRIGW